MIRNRFPLHLALCASLTGAAALADGDAHLPRADGHGPIGVMADHSHKEGEWMFSYRYMSMVMDGLRDGKGGVNERDVNNASGANKYTFMVAPTKMTMDMHMFGAMYAPNDRVTLMAMMPWVRKDMDHVMRNGTKFSADSSGLGDLKLTAMLPMPNTGTYKFQVNLGVSLPTGAIGKKDITPASAGVPVQLPYPMQLGSGTYDLMPGVTYTRQGGVWSWGAQANMTLRLGKNSHHYSLGNRYELTGWMSKPFTRKTSASLRVKMEHWGNVRGADPALNPAMVPTADPDRQGGRRASLGLGVNLLPGRAQGHRVALEWEFPFWQSLKGPQLEVDNTLTLGWQYSF